MIFIPERIKFNGSDSPSVGVEVELLVLDPGSFELAPGAPVILDKFRDDPHVKEELLDSIIEINTGVCRDIPEVRSDLRARLTEVVQTAESEGYQLVSMGTHPFSRWSDQAVTKKPRYQQFVERIQWPLRRLLITGIHVHIGVESGEKAIAVTNGLTRYIPHMIAMSANSPLHDSQITGLASTRTKLFEGMPTTGIPPQLRNYSEFQKYMRTLQKANTIGSIREVWWDIRPHPRFGTVETRLYDSVPSLDHIVSLAAFTQCLVVGISDHYDNGTQLDLLDPWILSENKWRATRHGVNADIITDDEGHLESLCSNFRETITKLLPISEQLGCRRDLLHLIQLADGGNAPYLNQLNLYQSTGDYKKVISYLVDELKRSICI